MEDPTRSLVKLVEKKASDPNSWAHAQQLIAQGADIRAPTQNGTMIRSVNDEAKRFRQTIPWKANNCDRLIQVLRNQASQQLNALIFSSNNAPDLSLMSQLLELGASCYQKETFGPLGLLGELLEKSTTSVRLDVIQFLIENDVHATFGLTQVNDQQETALSLAKNNPLCTKDVIDYLQYQLDMILNQIPLTQPDIDVNTVLEWIRRGANTETIDKERNTILCNAVRTNNLELTRVLVAAGCNTGHVNNDGQTPLQIAQTATPRNGQLVAILSAQNVNNELKRLIETKKSRLTFDEINTLLEKGANINSPIVNNNSFLHLLISNKGTPEMVTTFVNDFNAEILAMNFDGYRPIETCILVDKNPFAVLRAFFKLSRLTTNTFLNSKLNKSLLQFAMEQKRPEVAHIIQEELNFRLWNCVSRANTKDDHNQSLMPEIKQLIEFGANVDHQHLDKEYEGWTILHFACKISTKLFVQYLIEQWRADYTSTNSRGDYSIMIAAEYGNLSIVQYLHGLRNVNLNVANRDKQTPLHLAARNHHLLVARYLILWGADHQARNSDRQTPLDTARANISKKKEEELNDKKLISFLQQLVSPTDDKTTKEQTQPNHLDIDLDTCELVSPVSIEPIQIIDNDDEERLGKQSKGFLSTSPNNNLHSAAKAGDVFEAKKAIGQGADIRHRKYDRTPYEIAQKAANDYRSKINSAPTGEVRARFQALLDGCYQIMEDIRKIARTKLIEAIEQSNVSRAVAYLRAGAPLTSDLLYYICTTTDNVELVDYIINQNAEMFQCIINYTTVNSPYRLAKLNKLDKVASYLKFRLSRECSRCIQQNNIEGVKQLIRAGASVDMHDTNNLYESFKHQNLEMIHILCQYGAKMTPEWLQSKSIVLPQTVAEQMDSEVAFVINRCLIARRLRLAAASNDLKTLIQCQRLGADINSENCHGSTALLCSIQYGNYFSIVHALVSCGATMLHSNDDESMSLVAIAKQKKYPSIAEYLSRELNVQFLDMILNNDQKSASKFEALGADFNYQDEQKRTPLHYAVQFHGIDLVTWLCERGSTSTMADINGDYPITIATEKGDYAVVELFVTKYPATKKQTNKAGDTALQIAQKQGFKRIAQLLETGKAAPESLDNEEHEADKPKHSAEELKRASQDGHVKIIKEFCEQRYPSKEEKRSLCSELIQIAEGNRQYQIVEILQLYFEQQLNTKISSDMGSGTFVRLNEHYKKILFSFLTGLSGLIADSPVVLDPADPNTYKELFSNLTSNLQKRSEELDKVDSEQDIVKLSAKDMENINQKLSSLTDELNRLQENKESVLSRIQEIDEKLSKPANLSAIDRKDIFDQQEEFKRQLATFEGSMFLFQRQQEATLNKQNAIKFIKESSNLFLFYHTIENRLQALFQSALAAQGGFLKRNMKTKYAVGTAAVNILSVKQIPFLAELLTPIKLTLSTVLSKLDEKEQKKEIYNISTLGNIEELARIASDTAGLVTLYYKEQIESIDPLRKIKGSNVFNDKISWVKETFIDVRPEGAEEKAIVYAAEYVIAWMINALKEGKDAIIPTEPVPQQLWLAVAKTNAIQQGKVTTITDVVGASVGQQKIPLKLKNSAGEQISTQIRFLIGCVSVIGNDGSIYQYNVTKENPTPDLEDLELYGYTYIAPFSMNDVTLQSIITGRKLVLAKRKKNGTFMTRFDDIMQAAQTYQGQGAELTGKSVLAIETANQVAQVLREQRLFVDPRDVRVELEKSRHKIEFSIDVLREDLQKKTIYYQTTIEAADEKMKQEFTQYRESLHKYNEEKYNQISKQFTRQLKETEIRLEARIEQRMDQIEEIIRTKCMELQNTADESKAKSAKALLEVNKAMQVSNQSAQQATQANENAQKLVESTEQRRRELQITADKCENSVKRTIAESKEVFERTISETRNNNQQEVERSKLAAEQVIASAQESEKVAKDSAIAARDTQKTTREQLNLQQKKIDKINIELKEIKMQNERLVAEAQRAANATTATLVKITAKTKKLENVIDNLVSLPADSGSFSL